MSSKCPTPKFGVGDRVIALRGRNVGEVRAIGIDETEVWYRVKTDTDPPGYITLYERDIGPYGPKEETK